MSSKILHISDSYLSMDDATVRHNLGGLSDAVDLALEQDADAVVHTGNLFRRPEPDKKLIEKVSNVLDRLNSNGVSVFAIDGSRESYANETPLATLERRDVVEILDENPKMVGEVALYGIGHKDDVEQLEQVLDELKSTESFTCNIACVHQQVWPPAPKPRSDISGYDLLKATDIHLKFVLSGGLKTPREWEADKFDYQVLYSGSTNPLELESTEQSNATLLVADADSYSINRHPLQTVDAEEEVAHLRSALDHEPAPVDEIETETLADLYGLASRAKSVFEDRRKELRDELLERVDSDGRLEGTHAAVERRTYERKSMRSEERVFEVLENADIKREDVVKLDSKAIRDLVDQGEIDVNDVFELENQPQIRLDDISL